MPASDFARAIAQEINQASADHLITVEPTSEGAGAPDSARWFCACGARSEYDYLFPPTAKGRAAEHLVRITEASPSPVVIRTDEE